MAWNNKVFGLLIQITKIVLTTFLLLFTPYSDCLPNHQSKITGQLKHIL